MLISVLVVFPDVMEEMDTTRVTVSTSIDGCLLKKSDEARARAKRSCWMEARPKKAIEREGGRDC